MNIDIGFQPTDLSISDQLLEQMQRVVKFIAQIYDNVQDVSITLTDDQTIRELNRTYRGIDSPTDVLSFAFNEGDVVLLDQPLGEVVISLDKTAAQAKELGHSFEHELIFLLVHGMLHLLGFDHINQDDERLMLQEQSFIMHHFNYFG